MNKQPKSKLSIKQGILIAIGLLVISAIAARSLLRSPDSNADSLLDQALLAIELDDEESATKAISLFDNSDRGRVHRALSEAGLALIKDDADLAFDYLVPLDEKGPGFDQRSLAVLYVYLSRANQMIGAYDLASGWYDRAVAVDPRNPIVLRQSLKIEEMAVQIQLDTKFIKTFRPTLSAFCGACHVLPPADSYPKRLWKAQVESMFELRKDLERWDLKPPPQEEIVRWFELQAPFHLPIAHIMDRKNEPLAEGIFERLEKAVPPDRETATAFIDYVVLDPEKAPVMLVSNMRSGRILSYDPAHPDREPKLLGEVKHAARVEICDLDQDGIRDLLVAQLGSFSPGDEKLGAVVLLRGKADGTYRQETLLDGVGRVADVRAADVDQDGDVDLIVAEFGWRKIGSIRLMRNISEQSEAESQEPLKFDFETETIDPRHGTIHVPIVDINHDGHSDFVALLSQEHESVVAFLNDGDGKFKAVTLYTAPEPSYGSSGISLVDMDNDMDIDVLLTNGDTFDSGLLRPQQGVQWLENQGDLKFKHHQILNLFGAYSAEAADFDNDGDQDVVVVAAMWEASMRPTFLKDTESLILLENDGQQNFEYKIIERGKLTRITLTVADFDSDGDVDVASGHCEFHVDSLKKPSLLPAFDLFENQTNK